MLFIIQLLCFEVSKLLQQKGNLIWGPKAEMSEENKPDAKRPKLDHTADAPRGNTYNIISLFNLKQLVVLIINNFHNKVDVCKFTSINWSLNIY